MKTKLVAIGTALLGFLSIVHAQTLITNVTANPIWTDTKIALTNGEWVNVNAEGFWSWGAQGQNIPDGLSGGNYVNDDWIVTGTTHGNLIGFIGADPYQGSQWESGIFQTNQYLAVGTACQFMSSTSGELWLGINDDAFEGPTYDNVGSNYVTISLGFSSSDNYSNMTLSVDSVSSNSFSFYISNGIPNTVCAIYDSADLVHWTLLDSLILDSQGSSIHATDNNPPNPPFSNSGLVSGAFANLTSVPYRFYKVSNGPFWSQAIGFERMTVGAGTTNTAGTGYNTPGTNSLIADQLIAPANTLNALFDPMIDGSSLPNGSQILKWTGSGYDPYTYSSGSWSPNGNATLLPGEGAFLYVTNTTTVTFAGLVLQGCLTNYPLAQNGASTLISSMIPQVGGITSVLKYRTTPGDTLLLWNGTTFYGTSFAGTNGTGYTYPNVWFDSNNNITNEPTITVGESFFIQNNQTNTEYWTRKFPGCCDQ